MAAKVEKFKLQIIHVFVGRKLVLRTVELEEILFPLLRPVVSPTSVVGHVLIP